MLNRRNFIATSTATIGLAALGGLSANAATETFEIMREAGLGCAVGARRCSRSQAADRRYVNDRTTALRDHDTHSGLYTDKNTVDADTKVGAKALQGLINHHATNHRRGIVNQKIQATVLLSCVVNHFCKSIGIPDIQLVSGKGTSQWFYGCRQLIQLGLAPSAGDDMGACPSRKPMTLRDSSMV